MTWKSAPAIRARRRRPERVVDALGRLDDRPARALGAHVGADVRAVGGDRVRAAVEVAQRQVRERVRGGSRVRPDRRPEHERDTGAAGRRRTQPGSATRPDSPAITARKRPEAASRTTPRWLGRTTGNGRSPPPAPPPCRTSPPMSANTTSSRSCSAANAPTRNGGAWLVTNRTGRLTRRSRVRRSSPGCGRAHGRRGGPASAWSAPRHPRAHERPVGRDVAAHAGRDVARRQRLAQPVDLGERAEVVEVAAERLQRRQVVRVDHRGLRHVRLRQAGGEHVARQHLVLGVADRPERHALPRPARDGAVGAAEERRRAERGGAAVDPLVRRSERRARVARGAPSGLASGRGRCGPNDSATSSASAKPPSSAASQPGPAGTESCVRNATWSPPASSISRLRVPPWENSAGGISTTRAPWRRASSCDPSVEPESITSSSTAGRPPGRARRRARRRAAPRRCRTGQRDGDGSCAPAPARTASTVARPQPSHVNARTTVARAAAPSSCAPVVAVEQRAELARRAPPGRRARPAGSRRRSPAISSGPSSPRQPIAGTPPAIAST